MSAHTSGKTPALQSLSTALARFSSLDELDAAVGELSAEEEALLEQAHQLGEPTDEERQALGPDFVARITEATLHRIADDVRDGIGLPPPVLFREGLDLLRVLKELQSNRLLAQERGNQSLPFSEETTKLGKDLTKKWYELEEAHSGAGRRS